MIGTRDPAVSRIMIDMSEPGVELMFGRNPRSLFRIEERVVLCQSLGECLNLNLKLGVK